MNITAQDFTETLNKNEKFRSEALYKFTAFEINDCYLDDNDLYVTLNLKDQYLKDIPNAKGSITLIINFNIWDYVDFSQVIIDELASGEYVRDVEPQGDFDIQQLGIDLADGIVKG